MTGREKSSQLLHRSALRCCNPWGRSNTKIFPFLFPLLRSPPQPPPTLQICHVAQYGFRCIGNTCRRFSRFRSTRSFTTAMAFQTFVISLCFLGVRLLSCDGAVVSVSCHRVRHVLHIPGAMKSERAFRLGVDLIRCALKSASWFEKKRRVPVTELGWGDFSVCMLPPPLPANACSSASCRPYLRAGFVSRGLTWVAEALKYPTPLSLELRPLLVVMLFLLVTHEISPLSPFACRSFVCFNRKTPSRDWLFLRPV